LLSNAVKYTKQGFISIQVGMTKKLAASLSDIEIIIKDTGVGIETDKLVNIFTVFNKVMDDRELNMNGCGLGLSISKNLS
jgi:signal transduction histidine kinase